MHKASVTLQLCLWTTDVFEVTKAWSYDIDRLVLPQLETVCQPLPPVLSTSASAYERQWWRYNNKWTLRRGHSSTREPATIGEKNHWDTGGTRMGVAGGKQSDQEGERDRAWLPGERLGGGQWWHVREELGWPGVWGGGGEEGYVESLQSSSVSNSHAARADGPRASIIDRACATASSQGWRGWWCWWCWWWFSGRRDGWSSGGTARDPSAQARAWRVGGTRKLVAELFQTLTAAFICCALRTRSKWGWRKLWNAASVRSIGKIHCRTLNTLAINQSRSH